MRTVIKWLLIAVLAVGCKTLKTVEKSVVKTDSSSVSRISVSDHLTENHKTSDNKIDRSVIRDSSQEETIVAELSTPDSSGYQYPVKVTITRKTAGKITNKDIANQYYGTVNIDRDKSSNIKQTDHVKKHSSWYQKIIDKTKAWKNISAVVLCLGLLLLLYLILRRINVVK